MKRSMAIFVLVAVAVMLGAAPAAVRAQNFQDRTVFTEAEPFEVGNVRLEAGTYMIRVKTGDRNTIVIASPDERKVFATVASIPHPVPGTRTAQNVTFEWYPPVGDHPKALRGWVPMNAIAGQDVVYSKSRALEIAQASKLEVVAIPEETKVAELTTAPLVIETPTGEEKPYVAPPPPVTTVAEVTPAKAPEKPMDELPHTASSTPLAGLLGVGLLGVAAVIHRARQS